MKTGFSGPWSVVSRKAMQSAGNVLECSSHLPVWTHNSKQRKRSLRSLRYLLWAFCFILLHSSAILSVRAQSYSIDWFTIDGGGGTSTGGVYSVSGTVGQSDANQQPMTGGSYSLVGGYWSVFAVQTPGAPTLTIIPAAPGQATISWTPNTPGFVLQETLSLSPTNWVNSLSGATNPIVVPANLPTKFYRLFKP